MSWANIDKANDLFEKALEYFENEDFSSAEKNLKEALKKDPEFAQAYIKLGDIYLLRNKLTEARDYYEKALKINPDSILALYKLADTYLKMRMYSQSIKLFRECIKKGVEDLELYVSADEIYAKLGEAYLKKGDLKKAATFLLRALNIAPTSLVARYHYAVLLLRKRKLDEAEHNFRVVIEQTTRSLEISAQNPGVYFFRGKANFHIFNYGDAKRDISRAIELDTEEIDYHVYEGLGYSDADAYVALGEVYKKIGDKIKAEEYWKKALEIEPDHPLARRYLSGWKLVIW